MKSIIILGSTGSIGTNTLDIVQRFPEEFRVVGLTAGSNIDKLEAQIRQFKPNAVAVSTESSAAIAPKPVCRSSALRSWPAKKASHRWHRCWMPNW